MGSTHKLLYLKTALVTLFGLCSAICAAEESETPMVLELRRGDFVRGKLVGVSDDELQWQSPFMVEPLRFPRSRVSGIVTPRESIQVDRGDFAFELTNNRNQVFGKLLSIDEKSVELESPTLGRLKLDRNRLRRIARAGTSSQTFPVPRRLEEWTQSGPQHWRTDRGTISTDISGASLFADVNLPMKARIEIELQYSETNTLRPLRPAVERDLNVPVSTFAIHFGTDQRPASLESAFSIETWGTEIVAQRRADKVADVAGLGNIGPGSLHCVVHLDRTTGQMVVHNRMGKRLGEISVPATGGALDGKGITIVNRRGPLRLKQLHVTDWSGELPTQPGNSSLTISLKDDAAAETEDIRIVDGKLSLMAGDELVSHDLESVRSIDFQNPISEVADPAVLAWNDGTRLSGKLVSANADEARLEIAGTADAITVPLEGLRALEIESGGQPVKRSVPDGHREGTLELMDTQLKGWLVESKKPNGVQSDGSCLVWRTAEANNAVRLGKELYGRIRYVPATVSVKRAAVNQIQLQQQLALNRGGGLVVFGNGRVNRDMQARFELIKLKLAGEAIHLRSGDTIPCSVMSIDREGIEIQSQHTDTTHIKHSQIKAAQLSETVAMPSLGDKKRTRFLTLPRMQRNLPPQHLLFSQKGDILRGSVVSMGDLELDLEVRLDSHRIPRSRVSAIVWLHKDELGEVESAPGGNSDDGADEDLDGAAEAADDLTSDAIDGMLLQAVGAKGKSRFTFFAKSFRNQKVYGVSEILGGVNASLSDVDHLLFGPFINQAARSSTVSPVAADIRSRPEVHHGGRWRRRNFAGHRVRFGW